MQSILIPCGMKYANSPIKLNEELFQQKRKPAFFTSSEKNQRIQRTKLTKLVSKMPATPAIMPTVPLVTFLYNVLLLDRNK